MADMYLTKIGQVGRSLFPVTGGGLLLLILCFADAIVTLFLVETGGAAEKNRILRSYLEINPWAFLLTKLVVLNWAPIRLFEYSVGWAKQNGSWLNEKKADTVLTLVFAVYLALLVFNYLFN